MLVPAVAFRALDDDIEIVVAKNQLRIIAYGHLLTADLIDPISARIRNLPEDIWQITFPVGFPLKKAEQVTSAVEVAYGLTNNPLAERPPLEMYILPSLKHVVSLYQVPDERGFFNLKIKIVDDGGWSADGSVTTEWGHGLKVETKDQNSKYHLAFTEKISLFLMKQVLELLKFRYPNYPIESRPLHPLHYSRG
jgi:hypothetical protein